MVVNNAVPVSIVLEVVMVAAHSTSTMTIEDIDDRAVKAAVIFIDDFYMSIVSVFIVMSIAWFFYFKTFDPTKKVRLIRMYQGILLILAGVAMTWGAFQVKRYNGGKLYRVFELRIVSGFLAFADSILYFFKPKGKSMNSHHRRLDTSFPSAHNDNDSQVYVISHDLPRYEPPPSYFDIHPEERPRQDVVPQYAQQQQQQSPPPPFPVA